MTIPLVDLRAQYRSIKQEVNEAIQHVLTRSSFIMGEDVAAFEEEFASFCTVRHAVGVSSGSEALRLTLIACGIGPGDEVITSPFAFIAAAEAVILVGATPVFVDIDPKTHNMDASKVEQAVTPRTKAVLTVHLYGMPAEMDKMLETAQRHNLKVIEDASAAHGAAFRGRRVGSFGIAGCFGFPPGKNLGAYGDAGVVVTNDAEVAQRVRLLRDHGQEEAFVHLAVAGNSRIDTLQAAVLRVKLARLREWNARRRAVAFVYREALKEDNLQLPPDSADLEQVYSHFVVRTPQREALRRALADAGVMTGVHYPVPLHLQPALSYLGHRRGDFPRSEQAAEEVLSLPIYPEMTEDQVITVARVVRQAVGVRQPSVGGVTI
jgi:dTDP-4-amino-4,6-dideoxygalactose transaminase